jgi:arsenate reductase-like glutaredoxin family protein
MKKEESRSIPGTVETMNVDEVSVRGVPPFHVKRKRRPRTKELSPQGLCVRAGYPPSGAVDFSSTVRHDHGPLGKSRRAINNQPTQSMEVQIFGVKKSSDTRKALRFFSERRIKTHFVDLNERAASLGELRRFVQKFGLNQLIDRDSKRYLELGLQHARLSDERWLEKLVDEPLLLRVPLVRNGNALTIGLAEQDWKSWTNT